MTLKEQFTETLKLIIKPYEDDLDISYDCNIDICSRYSYAAKNIYCQDCDDNSICDKAIKQKVDLSITKFEHDFEWYIIFNKKKVSSVYNRIFYINNQKQMYKLLSNIKFNLEQQDRDKLDYLNHCNELRDYAKEFALTLKNDHFNLINVDNLPIIFHDEIKDDEEYCSDFTTHGNFNISLSQLTINIFNVGYRDIECIKRTVRHELIHYALYISDLKNEDDCAIFKILCEKYDAHWYKELTEKENILYQQWLSIEQNDSIKQYLRNCNDSDFYRLTLLSFGLNEKSNYDTLNSILKEYTDILKCQNEKVLILLNKIEEIKKAS